MGKLFNLKKWLTVDDAAKYLSSVFFEEVTKADVLHLAIDCKLGLSVKFVKHATVIAVEEKENVFLRPRAIGTQDVIAVQGIYDLPSLGCNLPVIEREYHRLADGMETELLPGLHQFFVKNDEGFLWLLDEEKYNITGQWSGACSLPADTIFVVRLEALRELERQVNDSRVETTEKPLGSREKETLLKIIGGLVMGGYGTDIHANRIEGMQDILKDLERVGVSVGDKTLREKLQAAAALIDPPQKNQ